MDHETKQTKAENRKGAVELSLLPPLTKPANLSEAASKVWDQLVPALVEAGRVTWLDTAVLCRYVEVCAEIAKLQEYLAQNGDVIPHGKLSWQIRPEVRLLSLRHNEFMRLADALGLTPRARQRIGEAEKVAAKAAAKQTRPRAPRRGRNS